MAAKLMIDGFDEAMVHSVVYLLRHVERDKKHPTDPQAPTEGGEIAAYAMGTVIRRKWNPKFKNVRTSPQPRGFRTAKLLLTGVTGWGDEPLPMVVPDPRLNDYSTDAREPIKAGIKAAKAVESQFGVEIECAIYTCPEGQLALQIKVAEAMSVLMELKAQAGDQGMLGLHGATIEGLVLKCMQELDPAVLFGMGAIGGQYSKVEGARISFGLDGKVLKIEPIRHPVHVKAMFAVLS